MDSSSIIDFFLPERQIGAARKRYGWIYKPGSEYDSGTMPAAKAERAAAANRQPAATQPIASSTQVARSSMQSSPSAVNMPAYVPPSRRAELKRTVQTSTADTTSNRRVGQQDAEMPERTEDRIVASSLNPIGAKRDLSSQDGNRVATRHNETGNTSADAFDSAREVVGTSFVGQAAYLDALCTAFKRPYVTGSPAAPRNTTLVLGGTASGRHTSLRLFTEALARQGILASPSMVTMNLGRYTTPQDGKIFLSDLYGALSSQSQVLVFDDFQMAHPTVAKVLADLVVDGLYRLDARYIRQEDLLMDSAGMLAKETVDEIHADGKYFFLVTERTESDVADVFGRKFMNAVGDIVQLDAYSRQEIREYCAKAINQVMTGIKNDLGIWLNPDATVLDYAVSKYGEESGFREVNEFLEGTLRKTLSNYKLSVGPDTLPNAALGMLGGNPFLVIDGQTIDLGEYMPHEYNGNLEEVRAELDDIIGLAGVKEYVLGIEQNLKAQRMRKSAGHKVSPISMHMIFAGNPGTGKTTIARIVAKYLKALGVLSSGHLREVSRSDLVGQYVGHTATQTKNVIESAIGGVLFVDEAYSLCRGDNDSFGLEAIDTLVKGMEDNRDDLVVILAGYTDEMADFLTSNPGLRSRFPNTIEFPDYTAQEMYDIAKSIARSRGYVIDATCEEPLLRQFEKSQVKGRNDSGNGRLARNVVEAAIVKQAQRILSEDEPSLDELTIADFGFEDSEEFDLEAELSQIIGLEKVKDFIREQRQLLIANQKRRDAGIKVNTTQNLNMLFLGNPGTGKTTVARIMANMLREMGYLKSGQLIEVGRSDLVSQYAGGTSKKTEDVFRKALGGVLFVDEAYSLSQNGDSYGQEAIDTLVKLIEDYHEDTVVILAGYQREMTKFLRSNSGLESRFPIKVEFADYTKDELVSIAEKMFTAKGFTLSEDAHAALPEGLEMFSRGESGPSGNGRMVRNYVENVLRNQSARIATHDASCEELVEVLPVDLTMETVQTGFDLEDELAKVIGLTNVKHYIRALQARLRLVAERRRLGLPVDEAQTLHTVFTGNPGTGKTTMARLVAKTLFNLGVITADKVVETDRAGLVAGYVGQTAIKTTEVVKQALGGVLFIDEAYSLSSGGQNDFGKEAIDTLVKLVDDNRGSIVVILAGYSREMDDFLATNPGLKSRFPNVIEFPDYSTDELLQIADLFYGKSGYILTDQARLRLAEVFDSARKRESFGNGRYVRNVYERSLNNQAMRLSGSVDLTREEITTIEAEDIEEVR